MIDVLWTIGHKFESSSLLYTVAHMDKKKILDFPYDISFSLLGY